MNDNNQSRKADREIWQYILLALYSCPLMYRGFDAVKSVNMETDENVFSWSLYILQMRGLICGCVFEPVAPEGYTTIEVKRERLMLTPEGFRAAEAMLETKYSYNQLNEIRENMENGKFRRYARLIEKYQIINEF